MDADYEHLSLEVKRLLARVDMHVTYGHYRAAQGMMREAVEKLTDLETLLGKLDAARYGGPVRSPRTWFLADRTRRD